MVFARNFFNKKDAEASYLGDASVKTPTSSWLVLVSNKPLI
jgi:hypothetical protein